MKLPAAARTLRRLLAGAFALAAGTTVVFWIDARGAVPGYAGWALALALTLLILAATVWLAGPRAADENAVLLAQAERSRARPAPSRDALERFVIQLAHEVKEPLTVLVNQAELLRRCSSDPVVIRDQAKSLVDYVRHLSDLFDGLLELESPVADQATRQWDPVPVHDMIVEAVRRCQSTARARGVSIRTTLVESRDDQDTPEVPGHAVLLETMLENVVHNAVRSSPSGSRVEVKALLEGDSLLLQVRGRGPGIPPSHLESVFDWCSEASAASRFSGAGFGLAIARRIAEHHRGGISLRNLSEGGSQFEIELPCLRATTVPLAHPAVLTQGSP